MTHQNTISVEKVSIWESGVIPVDRHLKYLKLPHLQEDYSQNTGESFNAGTLTCSIVWISTGFFSVCFWVLVGMIAGLI